MFLQILAVAALGIVVNGQIDVGSCTSYPAAANNCNQMYGIMGEPDLKWSDITTLYTLNANVYCSASNKANFTKLAECIQNALVACGKNGYEKLVATAEHVKEAAEHFCNSYQEIDVGCLSTFQNCVNDKRPVNQTMPTRASMLDDANRMYYCQNYKFGRECIESDTKLKNCAKTKTKELFGDLYEKLTPPECDASAVVFSSVLLVISLLSNLWM